MLNPNSLEYALLRWHAVSTQWEEIGGIPPNLTSFLAGWFMRIYDQHKPIPHQFVDSMRRGYQEANDTLEIYNRNNPNNQ